MGSLGTDKAAWHPLPRFHLKAPRGWLNDPCAPGYDPATGTYHLFYQCPPTPLPGLPSILCLTNMCMY
jgi:beta-fructofuranosidase